MDKHHIMQEIDRTAKKNGGKALGMLRFSKETGIRESDWCGKYWIKWSDALRETGYEPGTFTRPIDKNILLEKLALLVRECDHFPIQAEFRMKTGSDKTFPSGKTYRQFGGKKRLARALVTWCEGNSGWDDVREISLPVAGIEESIAKQTGKDETTIGFVYLLKSGKYYKIGRSNSPGRREYEISIQQPEPVKLIHEIQTDDPSGIEAYWHKRFADRRKNGEWFELNQSDVSAFKRRKFM